MNNNSKDYQHLKLMLIIHYVHEGLNAALLPKISGFSVFFSTRFLVILISTFLGVSQSSVASPIPQLKTVPYQLILSQSDRSLLLSQIIEPLATTGRCSLTVINGTSNDAYVKLIDPQSSTLVSSLYVESGSRFLLEEIPDGIYQVLFATGENWNPNTRSFAVNQSFSKFDRPLEFKTTQKEVPNGTEYRWSIYTITLHEVPNGNIRKSEISEEEFSQY